MFTRRQSARIGIDARLLVLLLCLALTLLGGHVCQNEHHVGTELQSANSSAVSFCPVCAVAHSLLVTVLFLLLQLLSSGSRTFLLAPQVRPLWRGVRFFVRPPPAY